MNLIQKLCLSLSMTPINGRINNALPPDVSKDYPGLDEAAIWEMLGGAERLEVDTCFDVGNVDPFRRNTLRKAEFYFHGVREPLVLDTRPAHMAFPRFPEQLFRVNANSMLEVIDNPYFSGDTDTVFAKTALLYIALSKLCGIDRDDDLTAVIENVTLYPDELRVSVRRGLELAPSLRDSLIASLRRDIQSNPTIHVEHFLVSFMPGMAFKSVHSLQPVKLDDGREAFQNIFAQGEWTAEDREKPFADLLSELSFDSTDDCPAYISHYERFRIWSEALLPRLLKLEMPLTQETHGMNCSSWADLFKTPSGDVFIRAHQEALEELFEQQSLNFGALLDSCAAIEKKTVN